MQEQKSDKMFSILSWASARLAVLVLLTAGLLMPLVAFAKDPPGGAESSGSTPGGSGHSAKMSRQFPAAALHALSTLREMRTDLAYTLNNGYPLEKLWLASDRDRAADALDLAVLNDSTEADHAVMRELLQYFDALQRWSDDLLVADREMRLAQQYLSPGALQNDEQYQALVASEEALSARLGSIRASVQPDEAGESSSTHTNGDQ